LAAQAFESRFQSFISQGRQTKNWAISAGLLLDASEAAIEEYSFLEIRARKQYEEAQVAYEKAFKNVQVILISVPHCCVSSPTYDFGT
jgi:hypothetical protein